jgi:hypothetical protein
MLDVLTAKKDLAELIVNPSPRVQAGRKELDRILNH